VNVAVLSGTVLGVGVEVQFVPTVHSAPGPAQVPSTARAGVTTAPMANNTANARTLLTDAAIKPPPYADLHNDAWGSLRAMLFGPRSADLLRP
jgi:hypothetical protein